MRLIKRIAMWFGGGSVALRRERVYGSEYSGEYM